jgi:pimeloyl-ACP methyl ester carboxylesterase
MVSFNMEKPMNGDILNKIYKKVPQDQKERLFKFRSSHPLQRLTCNGYNWEYTSSGQGTETLVLLPGGMRFGEAWFSLITAMEDEFSIIAPTYPPVTKMADLADGIAGILESEQIQKANFLGASLGGWLAQCFVRQYSDKVGKLILSSTSDPGAFSITQAKIGVFSVRYYPLSLLKLVAKTRILRLISPPDSECDFWKAFLQEKFLFHVTREDMISQMQYTLDYISNYRFSPGDLTDWPGKMLILESDDDLAFQKTVRESLKPLYPLAQIYTLHNAGHTPGYRGVQEYIFIIKKFLTDSL